MEAYADQTLDLFDGTWPKAEPFYRAPLYSYALAAMLWLARSLTDVAIVQAVLFAAAIVLIMLTTRIEGGRLAGWIAGLALLSYGGAAYWIVIPHSTLVELFLACLLLFLLAVLRQVIRGLSEGSEGERAPRRQRESAKASLNSAPAGGGESEHAATERSAAFPHHAWILAATGAEPPVAPGLCTNACVPTPLSLLSLPP